MRSEGIWAQALRSNRVRIGGGILLAILLLMNSVAIWLRNRYQKRW